MKYRRGNAFAVLDIHKPFSMLTTFLRTVIAENWEIGRRRFAKSEVKPV
jgi:hypothetical protein